MEFEWQICISLLLVEKNGYHVPCTSQLLIIIIIIISELIHLPVIQDENNNFTSAKIMYNLSSNNNHYACHYTDIRRQLWESLLVQKWLKINKTSLHVQ